MAEPRKKGMISHGIAAQNRKARFDYKILETVEAGLALVGPEVKSLRAGRAGRVDEAMEIQDRLVPLHDALFAETSPGPVKYAASLLTKSTDHCRLPLAPVGEATRARVRDAMVSVGLLN